MNSCNRCGEPLNTICRCRRRDHAFMVFLVLFPPAVTTAAYFILIAADALRRFFSGMCDKIAPIVPIEEPEDEGEPEESREAWRWEGSSGRV